MSREVYCPGCRSVLEIPSEAQSFQIICPRCELPFSPFEANEVTRPRRRVRDEDHDRPTRRRDRDEYDDRPPRRQSRPVQRNRSSGGSKIILVVVGLLCGLGILLGFGYFALTSLKPREFTTFKVPGGDCSILLPGQPKQEDQVIAGNRLKMFAVEGWNWGYGIGYADLSADHPKNLPGAIEAIASGVDGKVLVQTSQSFHGDGYIEFEIESRKPRGYISGRVMHVNNRFYEFFAMGRSAQLSNPDVRKFIDSFKLDSGEFPWISRRAAAPPAGDAPGPRKNPPVNGPRQGDPAPREFRPQVTENEEKLIGFSIGDVLRENGPPGELLVGFDIWVEKFFDYYIVRSVRPIYRGDIADSPGAQYGTDGQAKKMTILAKEGYAVGGINGMITTGIEGMSVTFMRVKEDKLDPMDSYESEWVAGKRGRPDSILSTGKPVIGVLARQNAERISALGLVYKK